jgi:hypothetical protein
MLLQRLLRVRTAAAACLAGASFFHTRSALLAGDDAAYAYTPPLRLSEVRSAAAKAAALPRVRVPRWAARWQLQLDELHGAPPHPGAPVDSV